MGLRSKHINFFCIIFLIYAVSGCWPTSPIGLNFDNLDLVPADEQRNLYKLLQQSSSDISSFRGLAYSVVESGLKKEKYKQVVVFRSPSDLRVELLLPGFNKSQMLILANAGEIKAIDFQENIAYQGQATAENIDKLINIPLKAEELALWMVGRFPLPNENELENIKLFHVEDNRGYLLLLDFFDQRRIILQFTGDRGNFHLDRVEIRNKNNKQTFFSELSSNENLFWLKQDNIKGSMKFFQLELNPLIPNADNLFKLQTPLGIKIIDLAITNMKE